MAAIRGLIRVISPVGRGPAECDRALVRPLPLIAIIPISGMSVGSVIDRKWAVSVAANQASKSAGEHLNSGPWSTKNSKACPCSGAVANGSSAAKGLVRVKLFVVLIA